MTIRVGKNKTIISISKFFCGGNDRSACFYNFILPIVNFLFAVSRKREYNFISMFQVGYFPFNVRF